MKVPESGAKKTMLDAAEVLVATNGFDAVSIRDITTAAKANIAAVNYHFGSRDDLMALVISHLMEPICEARILALESLGNSISLKSLAAAHVEFLTSLPSSLGMELGLFYRLTGRILTLPEDAIPSHLKDKVSESNRRFLEALHGVLPNKSYTELSSSWAFFANGIAQSLLLTASIEELPVWCDFAVSGLGEAKIIPITPVKEEVPTIAEEPAPLGEDSQPMLFDF
jgi:AcrR family transcriptional regulator